MGKQRIGFTLIILVVLFFQCSLCYEDGTDEYDLNEMLQVKRPRVDAAVKRPYRVCQGFEDPEEVDCYIRSDLKMYVCTEPPTFNPCESKKRVTTYHYDHIKHRCVSVNVPACSGQIIRAMSLIQCLIYCHNNDPFALGKSTSMVFKLNQKKPFISKDEDLDERDKVTSFIKNSELKPADPSTEPINDTGKKDQDATGNIVKNTNLNDAEQNKASSKKNDNTVAENVRAGPLQTKMNTEEDSTKLINSIEKKETKKSNQIKDLEKNVKKEEIGKDVKPVDKKEAKTSNELKSLDKNVKKEEIGKDVKPVDKKDAKTSNELKSLDKNVKKEEIGKVVKPVDKKDAKTSNELKSLDNNVKKEEIGKDVKPVDKKDAKTSNELKSLDKNVKKEEIGKDVKPVDKKDAKASNELNSLKQNAKKEESAKANKKETKIIDQVKSLDMNEMKRTVETDIKPQLKKKNDFFDHLIFSETDNNKKAKSTKKSWNDVFRELTRMKKDSNYGNAPIDRQSSKNTENYLSKEMMPSEKEHIKEDSSTKADNALLDLVNEPTNRNADLLTEVEANKKSEMELLNKLMKRKLIKKVDDTPDEVMPVVKEATEFKDEEDVLEEKDVNRGSVKKIDTVLKSDSTDKSVDDGFYLWDE